MTSASSLAFPGSRTLAGWWRQLASFHPQALAVGYLFLHRVEAPVAVVKHRRLERLSLLVLRALELESSPGSRAQAELLRGLETRLHLDRHLLFQMLGTLRAEGLVHAEDAWSLTLRGRQGLSQGEYPVDAVERRVFHFLERSDQAGGRAHAPHFLNLAAAHTTPWQPGADSPFDASLLEQCLEQSESWKRQFGFPVDVRLAAFSGADAAAADTSAWQRVIVDRPERMLVVLVRSDDPERGPRLLGFAARQDGWILQSTEPVLVLQEGWQELFPALASAPAELLDRAWRAWAGPRGLTEDELANSSLVSSGHQLCVLAPAGAVDRLRAARSDVFRGDAWLLVGEGQVRAAVRLELTSNV